MTVIPTLESLNPSKMGFRSIVVLESLHCSNRFFLPIPIFFSAHSLAVLPKAIALQKCMLRALFPLVTSELHAVSFVSVLDVLIIHQLIIISAFPSSFLCPFYVSPQLLLPLPITCLPTQKTISSCSPSPAPQCQLTPYSQKKKFSAISLKIFM